LLDGSLTDVDGACGLLLSKRCAGFQLLRSYDRNNANTLSRPAFFCHAACAACYSSI